MFNYTQDIGFVYIKITIFNKPPEYLNEVPFFNYNPSYKIKYKYSGYMFIL